MQKVQKIIKCKITDLTNIKEAQLSSEFKNVQTLLQLEKEGLDFLPLYKNLQLHSANRQQALRFYQSGKKATVLTTNGGRIAAAANLFLQA